MVHGSSDQGISDSEFAAEAVWIQHGQSLVRFATVLVGVDDAHDVAANAFVRVSRQPPGRIEDVQSYLYRAVANEARNHWRQLDRRRRRDLHALPIVEVAPDDPDIDLHRMVAALSPQQRAVIYLTYWLDMTESGTATALGLSTGTVHRTLERARKQLRKGMP